MDGGRSEKGEGGRGGDVDAAPDIKPSVQEIRCAFVACVYHNYITNNDIFCVFVLVRPYAPRLECGVVVVPLVYTTCFSQRCSVVQVYTEERLVADKAITDSMAWCNNNNERRRRRRRGKIRGQRAGQADGQGRDNEAQTLWARLYADDAGIVSRPPNGLERMMAVIVTACAAFGLMVSEAKTEIMCLHAKDGGNVAFTVTAAG